MEYMARCQGAAGSPDQDNDIYGPGPSHPEQQEEKSIAGFLVREEQQ
jgi:hypothetical protein